MQIYSLLEVQVGSVVKIITETKDIKKMGFGAGTVIQVVSKGPFKGPLFIRDLKMGNQIIVGVDAASKIEVEEVE